jgi:hypothetical protein
MPRRGAESWSVWSFSGDIFLPPRAYRVVNEMGQIFFNEELKLNDCHKHPFNPPASGERDTPSKLEKSHAGGPARAGAPLTDIVNSNEQQTAYFEKIQRPASTILGHRWVSCSLRHAQDPADVLQPSYLMGDGTT